MVPGYLLENHATGASGRATTMWRPGVGWVPTPGLATPPPPGASKSSIGTPAGTGALGSGYVGDMELKGEGSPPSSTAVKEVTSRHCCGRMLPICRRTHGGVRNWIFSPPHVGDRARWRWWQRWRAPSHLVGPHVYRAPCRPTAWPGRCLALPPCPPTLVRAWGSARCSCSCGRDQRRRCGSRHEP